MERGGVEAERRMHYVLYCRRKKGTLSGNHHTIKYVLYSMITLVHYHIRFRPRVSLTFGYPQISASHRVGKVNYVVML